MEPGYLEEYLEWLRPALSRPNVIELALNADGTAWVEVAGQAIMAPVPEISIKPGEVVDLCQAIAKRQRLTLNDTTSPLVSTSITFENMSLRVQIAIPPAAANGAIIGIRIFRPSEQREPPKFSLLRDDPFTPIEQERAEKRRQLREKAANLDEDGLLREIIDQRYNVIISGGTSTGKTTLGRRMLWMVDDTERLGLIEDSAELMPRQPNVVSLIADRKDASARSAEKLLQAMLRLRPDRIILGELRGAEAATFMQAINTGHSGSFTTLHAETARKALDRLALLVLETGTRLSYADVIRSLRGSIDVIIQAGRVGNRRGIVEIYFPEEDG